MNLMQPDPIRYFKKVFKSLKFDSSQEFDLLYAYLFKTPFESMKLMKIQTRSQRVKSLSRFSLLK